MSETTKELVFDIPFTQYLLPDGREKAVTFCVMGESAVKAKAILDAGLRFECEVLTTGEVSLTVFDDDTEEDVAIEVCGNGPKVHLALHKLIQAAAKEQMR